MPIVGGKCDTIDLDPVCRNLANLTWVLVLPGSPIDWAVDAVKTAEEGTVSKDSQGKKQGFLSRLRKPAAAPAASPKPAPKQTAAKPTKPVAKVVAKPVAKKVAAKPVAKPAAKAAAKPVAKPAAKPAAKPVAKKVASKPVVQACR